MLSVADQGQRSAGRDAGTLRWVFPEFPGMMRFSFFNVKVVEAQKRLTAVRVCAAPER